MEKYLKYTIDETTLTNICNSVRNSLDIEDKLLCSDIPDKIDNIITLKKFILDEVSELDLPYMQEVLPNFFSQRKNLLYVKLDNVVEISDYAFTSSSIAKFNVPKTCIYLGTAAFKGCSNLSEFTFNNDTRVNVINSQLLSGGYKVKYLKLPKSINTLSDGAFRGCGLAEVDADNLTTIGPNAFFKSAYFKTLILRTNKICNLQSTSAFTDTILSDIYVPDSLVDTYKQGTNWTAFSNKIKPLSEYQSK